MRGRSKNIKFEQKLKQYELWVLEARNILNGLPTADIAFTTSDDIVKIKRIAGIRKLISQESIHLRRSKRYKGRLLALDGSMGALEKNDTYQKALSAFEKAHALAEQHSEMAARISAPYEPNISGGFRPAVNDSLFDQEAGVSIYERTSNAHQGTWDRIRSQLQAYEKAYGLNVLDHNQLASLLVLDDEAFLYKLEAGKVSYGAEMGYLAIQRLKHIVGSSTSSREHIKIANNQLDILVPQTSPSSLLCYFVEDLELEITKLVLHAVMQPTHKKVWLGSARTVDATIKELKGEGIYLNCDDSKWSWGLNRAWLQSAVGLGYEIGLVEQHFPNIEKAFLSGDPVKLIEELAKEMRKEGLADEKYVAAALEQLPKLISSTVSVNDKEELRTLFESQYNGSDGPTATPQEVLILMDMGCVARKGKDGRISFSPPERAHEAEDVIQRRGGLRNIKRRHSAPPRFFDEAKGASAPPLGKPGIGGGLAENFIRPGSSVKLREEHNAQAKEQQAQGEGAKKKLGK